MLKDKLVQQPTTACVYTINSHRMCAWVRRGSPQFPEVACAATWHAQGLGVACAYSKHIGKHVPLPPAVYVSHNHTDHAGELAVVCAVEASKGRCLQVIAHPEVRVGVTERGTIEGACRERQPQWNLQIIRCLACSMTVGMVFTFTESTIIALLLRRSCAGSPSTACTSCCPQGNRSQPSPPSWKPQLAA